MHIKFIKLSKGISVRIYNNFDVLKYVINTNKNYTFDIDNLTKSGRDIIQFLLKNDLVIIKDTDLHDPELNDSNTPNTTPYVVTYTMELTKSVLLRVF
jgi:hypothetical protein